MRRSIRLVLVAGLTSIPCTAGASPGERFRPTASPNSHLTVESSQVVPAWTPSASLLIPYGQTTTPSPADTVSVDRRAATHVLAALGLADWAEISFDLPLIFVQSARNLDGATMTDAPSHAIGDLRIGAKGTILRTPRRGVGVGIGFDVTAPTGDTSALAGWGKPSYHPQALVDYRAAFGLLVSANLGYWARPDFNYAGTIMGDAVTYRIGARMPIVPKIQLSAVAEIDGNFGVVRGARHPVSLRAGLRWQMRSGVAIAGYAGGAPVAAVGVPPIQAVFSLAYSPPKMMRSERAFANKGRPGAVAWARRHDRIAEPHQGEATEVDPEDLDGDEVLVMRDRCPGVAEDRDGFEDDDGCPDLDNDADGLRDDEDLCPTAPELINGYLDGDGCPDRRTAQGGETFAYFDPRRVLPTVSFAPGGTDLTDEQRAELDQLAELLRLNPWMQRIHLNVYIASTGAPEQDRELADAQGRVITAYLVARGIERWRIDVAPARSVPEGVAPRVRLTMSSPQTTLPPLAPDEATLVRLATELAEEESRLRDVSEEVTGQAPPAAATPGAAAPVMEAQGPPAAQTPKHRTDARPSRRRARAR